MPRRQLAKHWSIEVDDSLGQRVLDGQLQMLSLGAPIRATWMNVWGPLKPGQAALDWALAAWRSLAFTA
jgi:hypothetical protein